jgi:hypothetical protein
VDYLVGEEKLPITRACGCVSLSRAAYYRKPIDQSVKDAPVVDVLNQIVAKHGRVILPFLTEIGSRVHAAMANRCFGVIPPKAMFGRS